MDAQDLGAPLGAVIEVQVREPLQGLRSPLPMYETPKNVL